MSTQRTTESSSKYNNLEKMSTHELLININREDNLVPVSIAKAIHQIEIVIDAVVEKMKVGGKLFYIGAGTSGRLGIVDASECPPTFGVPHELVIGIIAGGDTAIRRAVEFAEDDTEQGFKDLQEHNISENDIVIGIAASGTTPYVIGALETCNKNNISTCCIVCNSGSPMASVAKHPIEVVVGPEFISGSTRMKSGTAQKLVLNMISTAVFIKMERVRGNKMIDMQLTNHKLINRGVDMIVQELSISEKEAETLLNKHGSVRKAIDEYNNG